MSFSWWTQKGAMKQVVYHNYRWAIVLIQYLASLPQGPGFPLAASKSMDEREIHYLSGWKPAMNKALESGAGDPRGIIINNNTIIVGSTVEVGIASQNVLHFRPIDLWLVCERKTFIPLNLQKDQVTGFFRSTGETHTHMSSSYRIASSGIWRATISHPFIKISVFFVCSSKLSKHDTKVWLFAFWRSKLPVFRININVEQLVILWSIWIKLHKIIVDCHSYTGNSFLLFINHWHLVRVSASKHRRGRKDTYLILRILPIGLIVRLGGSLFKALASPSRKAIGCAFLSNVLNNMWRSVLLQEIKKFSIFLLNFLESPTLDYELYIRKNTITTHSTALLVDFESTLKVFQLCFHYTCHADKDSVHNIGTNAIYEGRFSWEKIYNTWNNALIYHRWHTSDSRYRCAYLQYIIKCVSISESCCCDAIEVFQVVPSWKLCHSNKEVVSAKIKWVNVQHTPLRHFASCTSIFQNLK